MLDWFKSNEQKAAEEVLAALAHAIKEVHPSRFIDSSEMARFTQPRLSQLNALLGNDDRFEPIAFDDLVTVVSNCERKGLTEELGAAIAHDAVLIALVAAATHERHGRAMRADVRERVNQLLRYVNPCHGGMKELPL
jgi:hypothetical protein